jgi:hypothetical protein
MTLMALILASLIILVSGSGAIDSEQHAAPNAAAVAKNVTRDLPAGVRGEEITFTNAQVKLAGTLLSPKLEAGKRAPAVLLITGLEQADRDGLSYGKTRHDVYRDIAEHLAARGLVVLRYDKRCIGASGCGQENSYDDLVDDARAALAYLRRRAEVAPTRIAVFGHSEGGTIASIVAVNEEKKVAGVVLAGARGRTLNKMLRDQMRGRMKEEGKKDEEIEAFLAKLDRLFKAVLSGDTNAAKELNLQDPYEALLANVLKEPSLVVSQTVNDPLQVMNSVVPPVLILQGQKDVQVSVKDAQYLEEALKRAQHADQTLHLLPDVDHLLKTNKGAANWAAYADAARPVDADLLMILTDWLQKKLK